MAIDQSQNKDGNRRYSIETHGPDRMRKFPTLSILYMRAMSSGGVLVNNKRAVGSEPVMRWALPRTRQARLAKLLSETVEAKVGGV